MLKFISLGCKVNSYESNALKELFFANGFSDKDNIVVINTCSVTAIADQKSRQKNAYFFLRRGGERRGTAFSFDRVVLSL